MEVRAKNPSGYIARNRTFSESDKIIRIISEIKAPGRTYEIDKDIDPDAEIIKVQTAFRRLCTGNIDAAKIIKDFIKDSRNKLIEAGGSIYNHDISK